MILISTLHHYSAIDDSTGDERKADIVTFYNTTKIGIYTHVHLSANYKVGQWTKCWPLVIIYYLDAAGINSYIVYKANKFRDTDQIGLCRKYSKELGHQLIRKYLLLHAENGAGSNVL